MKVMNVGNTSYSNQRQQNFGMRPNFPPEVCRMLGDDAVTKINRNVFHLRSRVAEEHLAVKASVIDSKSIRLQTEFNGANVNFVVSSVQGESTCEHPSCATFGDKINFALKTINDMF